MKTWLIAMIAASAVITVTIVSVFVFSGDDEEIETMDKEIDVNLQQRDG